MGIITQTDKQLVEDYPELIAAIEAEGFKVSADRTRVQAHSADVRHQVKIDVGDSTEDALRQLKELCTGGN